MTFESDNTESVNTQYHYVGKSSLYKFSEEWDLNSYEFDIIKRLNKFITPKEILNQRKKFRTTVLVRNIYSEVLNILQAVVMNKILNKKLKIDDKKYLNDAMMTSIAGISAAMKNTG